MTLEEMEEESARVRAHLKYHRESFIAELEEMLAVERNPYFREFFQKKIDEVRADLENSLR